ncbi:MAG: hypothetical protein H6876_10025 [Hyphomicrobiaceae bacterium]|nr:hypothetical protein [Hyphomicrobiaceae bacterium]
MRDLQEAGLHGLLVRIRLNDALDVVPPHVARCDDQEGRIGWSYPVTASIFDFSVEAPVQGLPALPNANIGIPWHCLVPVKRRKP